MSYARSIHSPWSLAATGWTTYDAVHLLTIEGGPNSDQYADARTESYHAKTPSCNALVTTFSSYKQNRIVADYTGFAYFNWEIVWFGDCWVLLTAFYEYWVD